EALVPSLARAYRAATGRPSLLRALAAERGFYVPSFYEPHYAADGTLAGYTVAAPPDVDPGVPGVSGAPGAVDADGYAAGPPLPVRKAALKTTEAVDPPATRIFTPDTEFGARFLVEVVRGC